MAAPSPPTWRSRASWLVIASCAALVLGSLLRAAGTFEPSAPASTAVEPPVPEPVATVEKSARGCDHCMRGRCHGRHQCGRFFSEPTGWQRPYCMCACCSIQCGKRHRCHGVPPHAQGFPVNVTTLAGGGTDGPGDAVDDGDAQSARFGAIAAIALTPDQRELLVADESNGALRVVSPLTGGSAGASSSAHRGRLLTSAGLPGVSTLFTEGGFRPRGIGIRASTSPTALVADTAANVLRIVDLDGATSTARVVGSGEWDQVDGDAADAAFASPNGVAVSSDGAFAVVADTENNAIRLVELPSGRVRTLAGEFTDVPVDGPVNGVGRAARFGQPMGVALSADDRTVYVADTNNHVIRAVDVATGATTTLSGSGARGSVDSSPPAAHRETVGDFHAPRSLCLEPGGGGLLVADTSNHRIRRVDLEQCHLSEERCAVHTLAGQGTPGFRDDIALAAQFLRPAAIAASYVGGRDDDEPRVQVFVGDEGNARVRQIVYDMKRVAQCVIEPTARECGKV
mmetsp:Transcript_26243/g.67823  ORF Transcript_26243/g.67823 Transcript_26243/m.67823 type:complete len:513 (+) Transcript_26243:21-1559(+)